MGRRRAVELVSKDRAAHLGQLGSNLMCSACRQVDFHFKYSGFANRTLNRSHSVHIQYTLQPARLRFTANRFRTPRRRLHVVDVPADFRSVVHECAVSLLYLASSKKLIELAMEFRCLRNNHQAAYFRIESLRNKKSALKGDAQLVKNVLDPVVDSRVNGNTGWLVHDDEFVVSFMDYRAPIHVLHAKALRLQVNSNILARRHRQIRAGSLPLVIDGPQKEQVFRFFSGQTEGRETVQQRPFFFDPAVANAPLRCGCGQDVHGALRRFRVLL